MDMNDYQQQAQKLAVYDKKDGLAYTALGLNGEAGEYADQVKKMIRNDGGKLTAERREKLIEELGDLLWYAAACAQELSVGLGSVAYLNLCKLRRRASEGTLKERKPHGEPESLSWRAPHAAKEK